MHRPVYLWISALFTYDNGGRVVEKKNSNASEEHLPTVNFQPAFSPSPMVNKRNDIEQDHVEGDVIG